MNDDKFEIADLRAKLAEAERQLEITQDGLMDVQKRLIDREDKLAEAERQTEIAQDAMLDVQKRLVTCEDMLAEAEDNERRNARSYALNTLGTDLLRELEALREVERLGKVFAQNTWDQGDGLADGYSDFTEALIAVDALRKKAP